MLDDSSGRFLDWVLAFRPPEPANSAGLSPAEMDDRLEGSTRGFNSEIAVGLSLAAARRLLEPTEYALSPAVRHRSARRGNVVPVSRSVSRQFDRAGNGDPPSVVHGSAVARAPRCGKPDVERVQSGRRARGTGSAEDQLRLSSGGAGSLSGADRFCLVSRWSRWHARPESRSSALAAFCCASCGFLRICTRNATRGRKRTADW